MSLRSPLGKVLGAGSAKEVKSVYRNIRYTVMCGESGRCSIRVGRATKDGA